MMNDPSAAPHPKRSFLKLPVSVDVEQLLADYRSIPPLSWARSHWNEHCSSDMLLLRGGKSGTADDFITAAVSDAVMLAKLPYIAWLLAEAGPFGRVTYAFLFRMKPMGVARPHIDKNPAWKEPFRVHVPITTNAEAFLLSEGRAKHFAIGEVWTFDNQAEHAVVNGATVRTHLIMDVAPNPKLNALLTNALWDPGTEDPTRWKQSMWPDTPPMFEPASARPLSVSEKAVRGLRPDGFAARVRKVRRMARLMLCPLREGDIITSVDGVTECPVAITALDYVYLRYKPGHTIHLELIRGSRSMTVKLRLMKDFTKFYAVRLVINAIGELASGPRFCPRKAKRMK